MNKQDREFLRNRQSLEEVKQVGYECENMAGDIKFNLSAQTHSQTHKSFNK